MANPTTAGELRKLLASSKATWTIDEGLKDTDPIPHHSTGGDLSKAVKVSEVARTDITPFLQEPTSNPFLLQLRINRGLIDAGKLPDELRTRLSAAGSTIPEAPKAPAPAAGGGTATLVAPAASGVSAAVDWRNRFGWPWLTKVKDQDPCGSCWCFSAVGALEATTRIEHTIWSLRSEGDVHDGMGYKCADGGWPSVALDWIKQNGAADPGCWAYETQNLPYKPTSDRSGRTVRLDNYVTLSTVADQKSWLDAVGPISACFTCYWDFQAYGPNSGVYICNPASGIDGGHCIVIVGYDDSKKAWLVRNSWGTGWGMGGYCWFGYGQAGIDDNVKYGIPLSATNPDPWTKRRGHAGNLYESGDGTWHRNFEVWTKAPGNAIRHYWRDGASLQWNVAETQANDCAICPAATGTTYNRNFELIYATTGNRLHHRYFDQSTGKWDDGPIFGPTNVAGVPAFIQSDYVAPGNFEVVVRVADGALEHWWRNEPGGMVWAQSAKFGSNIAQSGATLVQRFDKGLDFVCVNTDGTMQRWYRPNGSNTWQAEEKFGSNVQSAPAMIEGQYGATDETVAGNYELCVAVGGQIQHWWKSTPEGNGVWSHSATFGSNVAEVHGLIQSSFGFDLELIALLKDGTVQHWWRGPDLAWHAGPVFGSTVK